MGNLLLVSALAMLDVFTVSAPGRVTGLGRADCGDSPGGVFLMGATSGLVAAPCGAPAFAAVLTFVAGTGSPVLGFLYLFVFSLGMTALLVGGRPLQRRHWRRCRGWRVDAVGQARRWRLILAMAEYYFVKMGSVL